MKQKFPTNNLIEDTAIQAKTSIQLSAEKSLPEGYIYYPNNRGLYASIAVIIIAVCIIIYCVLFPLIESIGASSNTSSNESNKTAIIGNMPPFDLAGVFSLSDGNMDTVAGSLQSINLKTNHYIDDAVEANGLLTGIEAGYQNTIYLQKLIDDASVSDIPYINIPAGIYYFAVSAPENNSIITMKDNVCLVGAGMDKTILMPTGKYSEGAGHEHGIDMFSSNTINTTTLHSCQFWDFTIDSKHTQGNPEGYNASGKGFFFKNYEDCLWVNIKVANTDGTGFGMDFPINCALYNCIAIDCGKNATPVSSGASGFGIGTGKFENESILILNCRSYNNTKYGIFFEHQSRFGGNDNLSHSANGYYVKDCVASGNLYNFGGVRAHDIYFTDCISEVSNTNESYTQGAFNFENHSVEIHIDNCNVLQQYVDNDEIEDKYLSLVQWAKNKAIIGIGGVNNPTENDHININQAIPRSELATMLWRSANSPGDIFVGIDGGYSSDYTDSNAQEEYIGALDWLYDDGIYDLTEFNPTAIATRNDLYKFCVIAAEHGMNNPDIIIKKYASYENDMSPISKINALDMIKTLIEK